MIFWDSSAIVALIFEEPASAAVVDIVRDDGSMAAWWGTPTECFSAIARRESTGDIAAPDADRARRLVDRWAAVWHEVLPSEVVREHAGRLLRRHPLRAADALQLAAALSWARDRPRGHVLCTLDARLAAAARGEGFELAVPPVED